MTLQGPATLLNTWLLIRADNVIVHDLRVRPGDAVSAPADADAISLNGASNVAIDHVEAVWGPDVGGITALNDSDRVTVQYSIVGAGLRRSSHPEATDDADGHSYALNITGQGAGNPDCVTVFRNLIINSAGRNPQVQGASAVDVVNNVIYNFSDAPIGNPRGLNLVSNLYREGPAPEAAGLAEAHWPWKTRASEDQPSVYESSVYIDGNVADGFSFEPVDAPQAVLRLRPAHGLSVTPETVTGLLDRVLSDVGPTPDATTETWLRQVASRTGRYWNGCSFQQPAICFR
jgi:hypothetical protein